MIESNHTPKEGNYYLINGKRVLYWQDGKWWEAVKSRHGRYNGYIRELEKQPKYIKSIVKYNT